MTAQTFNRLSATAGLPQAGVRQDVGRLLSGLIIALGHPVCIGSVECDYLN